MTVSGENSTWLTPAKILLAFRWSLNFFAAKETVFVAPSLEAETPLDPEATLEAEDTNTVLLTSALGPEATLELEEDTASAAFFFCCLAWRAFLKISGVILAGKTTRLVKTLFRLFSVNWLRFLIFHLEFKYWISTVFEWSKCVGSLKGSIFRWLTIQKLHTKVWFWDDC